MNSRITTVRGQKGVFYTGAAALAISVASLAAPAAAQDSPTIADCEDVNNNGVCDDEEAVSADGTTAPSENVIVVTGSRIVRPVGVESPVPVTSVEAGELLDSGSISLGDALNDLPSLRSTFSTSNSQRFIGTTGLNILDLRGLGTSRTLTLVNGRRHITASAGDFQVDVNTIPYELLERVDVVTGGSSAVYGSDAIAGVVNFVLRRDYEGLELNGQAGMSERGDNGRYSLGLVAGKNFGDGRGNIALSAEFTNISSVLNSQRPELSGAGIGFTAFEEVDSDSDVLSNSDGDPDLQLFDNLRLDYLSEGGTVYTYCLDPATQPFACGTDGLGGALRFNSNGRLYAESNSPFPDGYAVGGTGSALSDGTLIPDIKRYNVNLLAHFDVSDSFRPYAELKYARIEAIGEGTPSFFNGSCAVTFGSIGGAATQCPTPNQTATAFIRFDNAYLNPEDAELIRRVQQTFLSLGGVTQPSQGFFISRNNSDFGTRNDELVRQTYRAVVGVEGDLDSRTRYDLSFTYGRFRSHLDAQNNLIYQNAQNAIDAVIDPSTGAPACRINVDADPNNNDASCIPINILGPTAAIGSGALDYINTAATLDDGAEQYDVLGYISTNSGSFFELPGGPISVVLGGEWRRETAFSRPDALSASGATFFNAFSAFEPPALEVLEGFGELSIPLLADMPFARELTLSGAARVSDYNSGAGGTGTVWAYNGNLVWAPIDDIRLRANYSRAVRSPTLSDLFASQTQNFLFFDDPCDIDFIDQGSATRPANCAADGVPDGFDDMRQGNRPVLQGGNPELNAETSDSYTIGGVFQPRFAPGLSFTVDYYNIKVKNVITSVAAQSIINNCYDAADLNNSFCDAVFPRTSSGSLDPNAALLIGPINFAKLTAEGLDFDLSYRKTFDNGDRLSLRAIATRVLDRTNYLDSDNPEVPNRVRGELGDPTWAANFNASYKHGPITLSYSLRFIDKMYIGSAENYVSSTQLCAANLDLDPTGDTTYIPRTDTPCTAGSLVEAPPLNPDYTAEVFYPSRTYHDLRLDFDVMEDYNFYVGVDNLTNEKPPFGLTGLGAGSGIYDNIGRYFYAGFRANF
ncbi:TonB-dependent receptor [Erythrobacter sp. LQ02-29]|uniref:TonB-dependent receptor domain-containing protein n=1 Tax=Erythrobacter sp. LQ02-29 TaxID=2920384 RepID=UPI001F4E979C|nr:TonB-dependent receptor [Erythrobacter sp. LQ02-29]MCP9222472.1 TonB-dependent receptor [Erythrobacter sp. LQ02-29]